MSASFGPWATGQDVGPTFRLSTFWRQRLTRLPAVTRSPLAIGWRANAVLVVVSMALAALPTILGTAASAEPKDNGPVMRGESGQPIETHAAAAALLREFTTARYFWLQSEAGEKLVELKDKSVMPAMLELLRSPDRAVRCNAGRVLAGLGDDRGLFAVIAEMNDRAARPVSPGARVRGDGGPDIVGQIEQDRYYAMHVLGVIGDRRAVPVLIDALRDDSLDSQAARVLGHLGDQRAVPALLSALERAKSIQYTSALSDRRFWAGYGLMGLRHPLGLRIMAEFLLGTHDEELRRLYPPGADAQRIFAQAASQRRSFAAEAFVEFPDKAAVPFLIRATKDEEVDVRVNAIMALGRIGDKAAFPTLRALHNDSGSERGTARLKYKPSPPLFKQMTVREAAAQAIEEIDHGSNGD